MTGSKSAFVVLGCIAAWWTLFAIGWRVSGRRLGVTGAAPPDAGPRERLVRRNLRAVLTFDLLILFPVGLPTVFGLPFSGMPEALGIVLTMVAGLVTFTLPIAALARRSRALRELRRMGRGEDRDAPSLWIDGPGAIFAAARAANPVAILASTLLVGAGVALAVTWLSEGSVPPQLSFVLFACGVAANEVSEGRRG